MRTMKRNSLLLLTAVLLSGCGPSPDVEAMKSGLIKSGMPADQATCYAETAGKTVDGEPYNYMAELMNAGLPENEASNKARRKYSAEFRKPLIEARKECVKAEQK